MSDIRYSIDGQILTDMADAIRTHRGLAAATCKITYMGHQSQTTQRTDNLSAKLLKGQTYKMTFKASYARNNADQYYRTTPTIKENNADGAVIYQDLVKQDSETVIIFTAAADITAIYVSLGENCFLTIGDVKIEPCDAEGNLTGYFTPQQMVDAVSAALPTKEDLVLTGDCEGMFSKGKNAWMLRCYSDLITTDKIYNTANMFEGYQGETIPFELNWDNTKTNYAYCDSMFNGAVNLKVVPKCNNFRVDNMSYMFENCNNVREFPEDFFDTWDWGLIDNATRTTTGQMSCFVARCYSLRKYPMEVLRHGNPKLSSYTYNVFYQMITNCYAMDEVTNVPKPAHSDLTATSNMFHGTLNNAYRLKDFTFEPGITLNWSKQTLDFSVNTGYAADTYSVTNIYKYNSGITADKEVKDDETYQALKNDPDWFTANIAYSRYDHDSAVRTINSLPTMTGTGNVIKFKGEAGSATDGGAINTLTESEIAVATAKGWTVTLV